MILKLMVLFPSLKFYVFSEDTRRAYFQLVDDQQGVNLSKSALQEKDILDCMEMEGCDFVVKKTRNGKEPFSKWYKIKIPSPMEFKNLLLSDCLSFRMAGETKSGVYTMIINGKVEQIPCDMKTDGGGWTVFQRRVDGTVDFNRNWKDYKRGFGDLKKNFWLGLDLIHYMISQSDSEMRIDLTYYKGDKGYAKYDYAFVADESKQYQLRISGYSGTAGDSLSSHNNMKFSTKDRDNDKDSGSCAIRWKGGFWFASCHAAHPNGLYPNQNQLTPNHITWRSFKQQFGGIVFIEMKFRRKV